MKIKNKLYISAGISIVLVVILVSLVFVTSGRIAEENEQHLLMMDVYESVSELDLVTYDYLLHREKRMEHQWNIRHNSLGEMLDGLVEEEGLKSIRADYVTLGNLFSQVTINYETRQKLIQEGESQERIDIAIRQEERLVAQLLITSHSIFTDASRLAEEAHTEATEDQRVASNLTVILMIILAITVGSSSFLIAKNISKPLSKLADYSRRVGEGEYTADIEIKGKDEVASVASDVKSMVGQLLATSGKLRESEELFRTLMEQSPISIQIMTPDGKIVQVNEAYEELWEITLEDLAEYNILQDEHANSLGLMPYIKRAFAGETLSLPPFEYDVKKTVKKGRKPWIKSHMYPIKNGKDTIRYVVMMHEDITERKKADEELIKYRENLKQLVEERTKELESFSYSVSHDLRAPLRAIDGFSKVLMDEHEKNLDEEGKRLLHVIRNNTQIMAQLIDDLLSFSRLGRKSISFSQINMENLVSKVFSELRQLISEREVELKVKSLPDSTGDYAMLHQVFSNLLSNAVKFTEPQKRAIIEVGARAEENENLYIIKDNGVGFDMKYKDKLFGVFQRLHSIEDFEGTGVGLAIVKRIIDKHGGQVWAEGEVNRGATFYFTLPKNELSVD